MLYLVLTVDGDWEEYYEPSLHEEKRVPDERRFLSWVKREIGCAACFCGGRFIHFIHTSPRARDTFLAPRYVDKWKEIEIRGGSVGIHCHEDDPHRAYYFDDEKRMEEAIAFMAGGMRERGLNPAAYRAGYMSYGSKTTGILERNGIPFDFSCAPGRHLYHGELLVSDWRGAPDNIYRMDRDDHRRPGESGVFEIPLGFYVEREPLIGMALKAMKLAREDRLHILSVLTHSYEYGSPLKWMKIKLALLILGYYGRFVNIKEMSRIIESGGVE